MQVLMFFYFSKILISICCISIMSLYSFVVDDFLTICICFPCLTSKLNYSPMYFLIWLCVISRQCLSDLLYLLYSKESQVDQHQCGRAAPSSDKIPNMHLFAS